MRVNSSGTPGGNTNPLENVDWRSENLMAWSSFRGRGALRYLQAPFLPLQQLVARFILNTTRPTTPKDALTSAAGPSSQIPRSVLGSWGKTIRDAVRNKEWWKRRHTPTRDPSTNKSKNPFLSRLDLC